MLQRFEFTKVCMEENVKRHFSRNFDIFSIKMTYLNALLPFLLSSRFSARSEAFLASYHCYRSLTVLRRSTTKCTTKPVGKMLDRPAIVFEETVFKEAFCSLFFKVSSQRVVNSIYLSPLPSGLVSEHKQICGQKLRMRHRMSVIYGHPVIAATRALLFADHVTKRNGGSGDENAFYASRCSCAINSWIPEGEVGR